MLQRSSPTRIGEVRHVLGATVTVALDSELAGIAPIYRGHLHAIGQIGSLVRIPQGLVDLVASVTLVGISELVKALQPTEAIQRDETWLQVQLLGEVNNATGKFERGIGSYPGLGDPVHFATPDDLKAIFPPPGTSHIKIGCLSSSEQIPVCLDVSKLVVRHCAIVGSTGAGKTSAVSSILQGFVAGGWSAANIVVIDPHGEYSRALHDHASVRSVLEAGEKALSVPYWALPAEDIIKVFSGTNGGATFMTRFRELVTEARKDFLSKAKWLKLDPTSVTADTPIPFDVREVWHKLDYENRETREDKSKPATVRIQKAGDPVKLQSTEFVPYNPGGQAPHKAPNYDVYGSTPDKLRLGLQDPQLAFFQRPKIDPNAADPLEQVAKEWLGGAKPISVLDFSGVPREAADLAIGVVLNQIFELALHSKPDGPGIGRPSPVLIVLEEAHRYLSADANDIARSATNRIAREGRKYGIGLMLVTQRPTELPDTALAQCGTIIALRLTNGGDQSAIRGALPDTVSGLAMVLPSLRTGEALISGEALVLPVRALLTLPNPRPRAEDPSLKPWREKPHEPELAAALMAWRHLYEEKK